MKKIKPLDIWESYKQERGCLVHFLRLLAVWSAFKRYTVHYNSYTDDKCGAHSAQSEYCCAAVK